MNNRKKAARAHIRGILAERKLTKEEIEAFGRKGSELTPAEVDALIAEAKPPRKKAAAPASTD